VKLSNSKPNWLIFGICVVVFGLLMGFRPEAPNWIVRVSMAAAAFVVLGLGISAIKQRRV
jgi:hypothetical protein